MSRLTTDHNYKLPCGKRKKFKLAMCWSNMNMRARGRESCLVHDSWRTYEGFHAWAWANGYKEGLTLCRTGDVGNYEPSNVRWDTQASNTIEAKAKHYLFLSFNVECFHNLDFSCLVLLSYPCR